MKKPGLSELSVQATLREFPREEHEQRIDKARKLMSAVGMDCLLLTWDRNLRYFSGFYTQGWINPTRPRYFLLPLEKEPVAILPSTQAVGFRRTSWVTDLRTWPDPRPADNGITLVVDSLRSVVRPGARIGAEIGAEMRMGTPVEDFLRIREALSDMAFVDATPVVRPVRMVKSPAEVDCMRRMGEVASKTFDQFARTLAPGQTERTVYRTIHSLLMEFGADEVPYVIPISGPHGYDHSNTGPTDRVLEVGDLLFLDVCASRRGYFSDFNRNFALGKASEEFLRAYSQTFEATQAGIEEVRPGRTVADVFRAMARVVYSTSTPAMPAETRHGVRMGHGLGLDSAEPPSIMEGDNTVLQEGMVLCIEPMVTLPAAGNLQKRLMIHEEDVVVTKVGCELLNTRASPTLPVV